MNARERQQKTRENPTLFFPDEYEDGHAQLAFEVGAQHLELEEGTYTFTKLLRAKLTVHRALDTYTLTGLVDGILEGECCRCLEAATAPFAAELNLLLQRRQVSDQERAALEEDDGLEVIDPGIKEVDLQPFLREAILLDLPMRIYCRDQCKGLCPQCGENLNESACACAGERIDSRWSALEHLKS